MFAVFENDLPAEFSSEGCGFENCQFLTFDAARDYAMLWLGMYAPPSKEAIKLNEKFFFYGKENCYITIRKFNR